MQTVNEHILYLRHSNDKVTLQYTVTKVGNDPLDNKESHKLLHRHCHGFYEIYLFFEGDVDYVIEGTCYNMHPYDLLVIKPSMFHYARSVSNKNYRRFVIHFSPDCLNEEMHQKLLSSPDYIKLSADSALVTFLESLVIPFSIVTLEEKERLAYTIPIYLASFILNSVNKNEAVPVAKENTLIEKIKDYVRENLTKPITLEKLSEDLFFNKFYICRLFKEKMGISLMEYIRQKKLVYAKELIDKGYTAYNASVKAGFSNYTTFYRNYKDFFSKIPSKK